LAFGKPYPEKKSYFVVLFVFSHNHCLHFKGSFVCCLSFLQIKSYKLKLGPFPEYFPEVQLLLPLCLGHGHRINDRLILVVMLNNNFLEIKSSPFLLRNNHIPMQSTLYVNEGLHLWDWFEFGLAGVIACYNGFHGKVKLNYFS
jgi:hypothetical protein